MKKLLIAALSLLSLASLAQEENTRIPMHDKERTQPYPRVEHDLYLNPPPLVIPSPRRGEGNNQFSLSRNADFSGSTTQTSPEVPWYMYSPHRELESGVWYWKYRTRGGKWSDPISFTVKESTPRFATPSFEVLKANLPKGYPRLFCFLDEDLVYARANSKSHPEYKEMIARAKPTLTSDPSKIQKAYAQLSDIRNSVCYLHAAYLTTGEAKYRDRVAELLRFTLKQSYSKQDFDNDFFAGFYFFVLGYGYDICYSELTPDERKETELALLKVMNTYYKKEVGYEEIHLFDNHFWQHSQRDMVQLGILLADKYPEAEKMLRYYYELWCTRAPASAFNRDGNWINGTGYFNANLYTLYYVPSLFSHLTGHDFLQHPWYRNAGKAMLYAWPPNSLSGGFGDGNERSVQPPRQRLAFAEFIARETGDPYATWYVQACNRSGRGSNVLSSDFEMRLYRIAKMREPLPTVQLPVAAPKAVWFKDCGEFVAHSDLNDPSKNLFLSFRSSPYGSGSHTLADQNSFNLHYRGVSIYRMNGYYLNFSDAHNLLSYRHTRAHNTLLVDGIGQPFSSKGYGNIVRAFDGENISYALGDASMAYSGVSDDPMWINFFKKSDVEQSIENGFGKTPLKGYRRHIALLHPDKVVIYDELEADKAVSWDWLLHSLEPFEVDEKKRTYTTRTTEKNFVTVARQFSPLKCKVSVTDEWAAAPNPKLAKRGQELPKWQHLTASYGKSKAARILTVIQILPDGAKELPLVRKGNRFTVDHWTIEAELNADKPALFVIDNTKTGTRLDYGSNNKVAANKQTYLRKLPTSTVLYDRIDGKQGFVEQDDRPASPTR